MIMTSEAMIYVQIQYWLRYHWWWKIITSNNDECLGYRNTLWIISIESSWLPPIHLANPSPNKKKITTHSSIYLKI